MSRTVHKVFYTVKGKSAKRNVVIDDPVDTFILESAVRNILAAEHKVHGSAIAIHSLTTTFGTVAEPPKPDPEPSEPESKEDTTKKGKGGGKAA